MNFRNFNTFCSLYLIFFLFTLEASHYFIFNKKGKFFIKQIYINRLKLNLEIGIDFIIRFLSEL
jgi:hypothetical protein